MLSELKKYYIETYGCQMNFSDSGIIGRLLNEQGYIRVDEPAEAGLILVNTCAIREHAEQRVLKRLRELSSFRKKNKNLLMGLLGCMAERVKETIFAEGIIDIIAGPDSYRKLPGLISTASSGNKAAHTLLSAEETYADIKPVQTGSNNISAFISIMRGCENFCTYCVVPYARGKERSRNPETIVNEAACLFSEGYREITLLGQNVNSYMWKNESDLTDFPELIAKVADISPLLRIRFATSHPKDISDKLLKTIAAYPNICKSIHLPLQSGSNQVLKKMNRGYTREYYLERIDAIRRLIPGCGLSTDIIAGFCGEKAGDHTETLEMMSIVHYDYAFMFKYSQRSGTAAAAKFADDVSETIKNERLTEIIKLQQKLSLQSNRSDIGKYFEVLVEGTSKRSAEQLSGRTSHNKVVVFDDHTHKAGDYVMVKITDCTTATLKGKLI